MSVVDQLAPEALISHAWRLVGDEPLGTPAHALDLRRAVSSAYYAVFHEVCFARSAAAADYDRLAVIEYDDAANAVDVAEEALAILQEDGESAAFQGFFALVAIAARGQVKG